MVAVVSADQAVWQLGAGPIENHLLLAKQKFYINTLFYTLGLLYEM